MPLRPMGTCSDSGGQP